jgi:membrane protein DedA with SNARE-associated domain
VTGGRSGAALTLLVAATSSSTDPGGITGWLLHFNGTAAYVIIGFLAFAEAGLLVGFFIPGETAVVIGGVLAGLGTVNLELMMAVVVVCAIVGDSCGYELGKRAGPWLLDRRPLKGNTAVRRTMGMLERFGGPAVFLGRFVAFARAFIPGLAGMSGVRYRTFLLYNAVGGVIWGVGYTMLGFVVGLSFEHIVSVVGRWSILVVAVVVVGVVAVHLLRRRQERELVVVEDIATEAAPTHDDTDVPSAGGVGEGPDPDRSL